MPKKGSSSKEYLPVNSERINYPEKGRVTNLDELIIDINDISDAARACATNPMTTPVPNKFSSKVQIDDMKRQPQFAY